VPKPKKKEEEKKGSEPSKKEEEKKGSEPPNPKD
jgi:hypothetical protein